MVKKFKAMAEKTAADSQLASAIKDSAQQIWLAGLGAFAKAQGEGAKMFETLVTEGTGIQRRTKKMAEATVNEMTGKVSKVAGEISKQATEGWDKLEQVFEDRVARAMSRLGMPTSKEVAELMGKVDELSAAVAGLTGKPLAPRKAKKSVVSSAATKVSKVATTRAKVTKSAAKVTKSAAKRIIKAAATKARNK